VRTAVRDPAELAALVGLTLEELGPPANSEFALLAPRSLVARMRRGDPHDPLLRQVWPAAAEAERVPGFDADPVREQSLAAGGLIRKYAGRVLLIASGACPLHCRYCFRREFPYGAQLAARGDWNAALAELGRTTDASEVILSGGDPLSLSNRRIRELVGRLGDTAIATLRVHTRFPIAVPERIDDELLAILAGSRLRTVVVIHSNHANELDEAVAVALERLRRSVTALLNQSVLLAGINDDAAVLARLSERLFACGVLPYYLHLLDRVAGAAHFEVDEARGRELIAELRARLPGYLVPRLVRETAGQLSKTPIF
jgi:EF-P beta-lysylation protein EpmB